MPAALLIAIALAGGPDASARWMAGTPPVEDNLRLVRVAPIDGNPREAVDSGRPCLRTDDSSGNRYIYFDVSRRWLRTFGHEPYRVEATVTYLDEGAGPMALQFDGMGNTVEENYRQITWRRGGSGTWRSRTVVLEGCEFRNAQQGRADLRLAVEPGADGSFAELTLKVLSASKTPPTARALAEPAAPRRIETSAPLSRFNIVTISQLCEASRTALERLEQRLAVVGGARGGGTRIVAGKWRPELARRYPKSAAVMRRLAADRAAFRRRDGYAVVVERTAGPAVVCAFGLEPPGVVYAIGDLHIRALRDHGRPVLRVPARPRVEAPALDRRELYLNIGYGLMRPRITVEDWSLDDWKRYIDRLVLARYNTWSFYLWGDGAMLHPAAVANRDLNLRVHTMLREAIRYSHRRGMKVGLQFTPTMVPIEIWKANPTIQAKLEYVYPGTVCPSQEPTWRWMREVQEREIAWFRECDFFSLWFYDVGGCFCETCRDGVRQLGVITRQAETFAPIVRRANPRAVFQVMAWAIWRYERMHKYSIRDRFIASLRKWFAERRVPLEMADGIYIDPGTEPLFPAILGEGLPAKAFLYQTNIETGQPLPIVQTRYMSRWAQQTAKAGATSAFLMRMEAGTKQADDAIGGRYLWEPSAAPGDAILDCARQFTGDVAASIAAWHALRRIDDFAWFGRAGGQATARSGARIAAAADRAAAAAPAGLRAGLEWLATAGRAYRILGAAVDARDDEDEAAISALDRQFTIAMKQSPLYRGQAGDAPYWRDLFRAALVRYFHAGWAAYHF